jgi:hypothetical protein
MSPMNLDMNLDKKNLLPRQQKRVYTETKFYIKHNKTKTWIIIPVVASNQTSSIDMYNNDVGKESAQKFIKQTDALKADTLYFAS